jgi:hypothetical protein
MKKIHISEFQKRYLLPLVVGILGSLAVIVIPWLIMGYVHQHIWSVIYSYNSSFSIIESYQSLPLYFTGPIIICWLSVKLSGSVIRNDKDAILAGALSGLSSGFIVGCLFVIDNYHGKFSILKLPFFIILPFIIDIVTYVLLQMLGAYLYFRINQFTGSSQSEKKFIKGENNKTIKYFIIGFLILLIIIITPPLFVYSGIIHGSINRNTFCDNTEWISVTRLSTDSIIFTQSTGKPEVVLGPPPETLCWQIFVNGKNVSDQSAIQRQQLSDSIIPADGLHFGEGSSVILTGPTISNSTGPVIVKVFQNDVRPGWEILVDYV